MFPSPTDLYYFQAIVEDGRISHAAKRLGISQPSLSMAIKRLERYTETPIFIRSKKGVTLTRAGNALRIASQSLLEHWNHVKESALATEKHVTGLCTIGCHTSVGLNILPNSLPTLLQDHPDVQLKLIHSISQNITAEVNDFKIDIGLVVNPPRHDDLVIHTLYKGALTFWHADQKTKTCDPYSGDAVLIADPSLMRTSLMIKAAEKKGFKFKRILPTTSLDMIAALTQSGCGIGLMPEKDAHRYKSDLIALKKAPIHRDDHCLIYRVENKKTRVINVVKDAILTSFRSSLK